MALTEKGKWTDGRLTDKARKIFNNLTEQGQIVFGISTPPSGTPIVSILNIERTEISRMKGADKLIVTFKFNLDVQAYTVNVLGISYDTGTVAHSGTGNITAGTEVYAEIDWTELYQEGDNRVNIYGQGLDGSWTSFDSNGGNTPSI